jgi:NosR/NirI family nitrous oxide reductase transcriptional regulator
MQLPIVDSHRSVDRAVSGRRRAWSDWLRHVLRISLIVALTLGLHQLAALRAARRSNSGNRLSVENVQDVFPNAASLRNLSTSGLMEVLDAEGQLLATIATTSPEADRVVGYSGPNNVLLTLSPEQSIQSAKLIASGDTRDHVELVNASERFWQQFIGMTWGSTEVPRVDGVSGATLTSLAIAEAIALRISGRKPSLRFPDAITREEVAEFVPQADESIPSEWLGLPAWKVAAAGISLGRVVRTGTLVDSIEGYQGPTELLLWIDPNDVLLKAKLRRTYDNQPYVRYVEQEYSFWPRFQHRQLSDVASMDFTAEVIEGVSGATMTSMAVAETIKATAEQLSQSPLEPSTPIQAWNWSTPEIATAVLAALSIPWSRSRWRTRKLPRGIWQLTCFIVIGLYAGNLLSLALLAGWTRGGVPVNLAPGMTLLLVVAIVWPMVAKQNVYCDHVCPHGALQQWLRPFHLRRSGDTSPTNSRKLVARALSHASWIGVLLAGVWIVRDWPISLSALEPFDAYAWRIGISFSSLVWLFSLMLVWWRPMAYCQLACPTGRILDTVRFARRRSGNLALEICLAIAAACVWTLWSCG